MLHYMCTYNYSSSQIVVAKCMCASVLSVLAAGKAPNFQEYLSQGERVAIISSQFWHCS